MQIIGKYFTVESVGVNVVPENWTGHEGLQRPTAEQLEQMVDAAEKFCTIRSDKPTVEIVKLISSGDLWANSTLRYALAKEIKKTLSADPGVRDLYVFGSVMEDRARLTSNINLILHVEDKKEDYQYWLILMDEGLVKIFRARYGLGKDFRTLLDCHVVNEEGVSSRAGYGALLTSPHANITRLG